MAIVSIAMSVALIGKKVACDGSYGTERQCDSTVDVGLEAEGFKNRYFALALCC